jgi:hypothetical protein
MTGENLTPMGDNKLQPRLPGELRNPLLIKHSERVTPEQVLYGTRDGRAIRVTSPNQPQLPKRRATQRAARVPQPPHDPNREKHGDNRKPPPSWRGRPPAGRFWRMLGGKLCQPI